MKKTIAVFVIGLLGLSANAAQVIELRAEQSELHIMKIKSALVILMQNGLLTRNVDNGKIILNSKEVNSNNSQNENSELIDIDKLENDMRISHVTDI